MIHNSLLVGAAVAVLLAGAFLLGAGHPLLALGCLGLSVTLYATAVLTFDYDAVMLSADYSVTSGGHDGPGIVPTETAVPVTPVILEGYIEDDAHDNSH